MHKKGIVKPNLFIVGAPRCGTSSLWTYLKDHPEVFMSSQKELYFFDSDLRDSNEMSAEEYLRHFSGASSHKKVGEATPSYLRSPYACQAIKNFNPGAQIIVMLRNPVDVLHSLHSLALYGSEPITDFAAALEADVARNGHRKIGYREFTDFPEQVRRYYDQFGRENVHVIVYDDLKTDSAAVGQNTLRFLGVHQDVDLQFPWINSNKKIRVPRLEQMLCHPPVTVRRMAGLIPRQLRRRARHGLSSLNATTQLRPAMDPDTRKRLQEEFEPKVVQLSKLLGRDLSGWCRV